MFVPSGGGGTSTVAAPLCVSSSPSGWFFALLADGAYASSTYHFAARLDGGYYTSSFPAAAE